MRETRVLVASMLAGLAYELYDLTLPDADRGWQRAREPIHTIEARSSDVGSLIGQVYRESLFVRGVPARLWRAYSDGSPRGKAWVLDVRAALGQGRLLRPIVSELVRIMDAGGITQVAGRGYGAFLLLGAVAAADDRFRAGLVRDMPRRHGTRRLIEGGLEVGRPLLILDDVVSTGRTAAKVAATLRSEGYEPRGVLAVFRHGWQNAVGTLDRADLTMDALGVLHVS